MAFRRLRSQKGSILAWVLVTSVMMMVLCASLARVILMRAQHTQRQNDSIVGKKLDNDAVARLMSAWSSTGANQVCDNNAVTGAPSVGYSCTGVAGTCNCTCTGVGLPSVKIGLDASSNCRVCSGWDPQANNGQGGGVMPATCP